MKKLTICFLAAAFLSMLFGLKDASLLASDSVGTSIPAMAGVVSESKDVRNTAVVKAGVRSEPGLGVVVVALDAEIAQSAWQDLVRSRVISVEVAEEVARKASEVVAAVVAVGSVDVVAMDAVDVAEAVYSSRDDIVAGINAVREVVEGCRVESSRANALQAARVRSLVEVFAADMSAQDLQSVEEKVKAGEVARVSQEQVLRSLVEELEDIARQVVTVVPRVVLEKVVSPQAEPCTELEVLVERVKKVKKVVRTVPRQ